METFLDEYKRRWLNPVVTYLSLEPATIAEMARFHLVVRSASLVSLNFSIGAEFSYLHNVKSGLLSTQVSRYVRRREFQRLEYGHN
jgi:predicted ATP-dependent Lon-type protease